MLYILSNAFLRLLIQHIYLSFLSFWMLSCPLVLFAQKNASLFSFPLSKQADSLYYHKQFEAALPLFSQIQQTCKDRKAWQQQAIYLQQMGNCYRELGEFEQSKAHLDSAIAIMETKVGREPTHQVFHMYLDYSQMLRRKGRLVEALEICKKAVKKAEDECEPNALILAHIYRDLGGNYQNTGDSEQAFKYLQKSKALYEQLGANMEQQYSLYNRLFNWYYGQIDFENALEYLLAVDKWLSTYDKIPLHVGAETIYINLGIVYLEMGNYPLAAFYNQKALALCKERFGENYYLNVYILQAMGRVQMDNGELEAAVQTFKEGYRIGHLIWKKETLHNYTTSLFLAESLEQLGRDEEADIYWKACFAYAADMQKRTEIFQGKTNALTKRGRWAEALALYDEQIAILEKDTSVYLGQLYLDAGKALYNLQRYEAAASALDKGIALFAFTALAGQSSKVPTNTSSLLTPFLYSWKAKTLLAQWKKAPDRLTILEKAWENIKTSKVLLEEVRQLFYGTGDQKYNWQSSAHEVYGLGIEIAQLLAQRNQKAHYWEQAFYMAEKDRAMTLLENLHLAGTEAFWQVPASLQHKEIQLTRRAAVKELAFYNAIEFDSNLYNDVLSDRKSFDTLLAKFSKEHPNYYAFKYDRKPASVQAVQQRLPADAMLVSYFMNQATNTLYIFAIDKKTGLHLYTTPLPASLSSDVAQLAQLQRSVGLVQAEKRQQFIQLNHAFYKTLIGPLEGLLADKKRLIVVANDVLHYLPFEALLRSDANKPFDQLDFLLRRFEVSYHYSASLYAKSKASVKPAATPKVLAFAPNFLGAGDVMRSSEDEQTQEWNDAYDPLSSVLRPLPYSVQEVRTVLDSFSGAGSVGLVKEQATEAALKRALGSPYDVLHFATHSFANVEQPSLSGISCGQGMAQDSTEDGTLYVNELYQMPLSADLVVLSSCESGVGHSVGNEGPLGINRAFAYAGVPNVLFSLWKVNDKAGSALMVEFYRQLHAGKTYSAALRAAKLKLLSNITTASPNFWSGFLLVGN